MQGMHAFESIRNAALLALLSLVLAGCLSDEKAEDEEQEVEINNNVTGSVGDGPVVGASMRIRRKDGQVLEEFVSDTTADFDVTEIDPATVTLMGVAPLRWDLEDVATPFEPYVGKQDAFDCTEEGADGYTDLTLKFDAQEIVGELGEVSDGEVLVLHLTGSLDDHTFYGEDVIVILKKGKK